MPTFTYASDLQVPAEQILAMLTMEGVNAELNPLVKMTAPAGFRDRSILLWPVRQHVFNSWVLLFGCIPIDRHAFYFDAIHPADGFVERSTSISNKLWCHERKIQSCPDGSRVVDTVSYKSRVLLLDALLKPLYQIVFWRRHQNLRAKFAGRACE